MKIISDAVFKIYGIKFKSKIWIASKRPTFLAINDNNYYELPANSKIGENKSI